MNETMRMRMTASDWICDLCGASAKDAAHCVGIETPAGRVMVGERRAYRSETVIDGPMHEVVSVGTRGGSSVVFTSCEGREAPHDAARVATWPLVPATLAQGPLAKAMNLPNEMRTHSVNGATVTGFASIGLVNPPLTARELGRKLGLKMVDPRAAREQRRREIDRILAEDARRFPAFATARKSAVVAAADILPDIGAFEVRDMLPCLHQYEALRGGMGKPTVAAAEYAAKWVRGGIISAGIAHYERNRAAK